MPTKDNVTEHPDGSRTIRTTKLRQLQVESGMPAFRFAAKAGIHHYVFSQYALGKQPISRKHMAWLCQEYGVTPEDITGWVAYRELPDGQIVPEPSDSLQETVRQSDP